MTAVPKSNTPSKLHCGELPVSQSQHRAVGEADAFREETSKCTGGELRDTGPGDHTRNTGNNIGKDHLPAGTGDDLQRREGIGTTEAVARVLVWRMGSYERVRGRNDPRSGWNTTTTVGNAQCRAKEPWDLAAMVGKQVRDTVPGTPVNDTPWRVRCQSRDWRGVCAPTLEPPSLDAGRWRKARPPNRTRETRPSGMTTEAAGTIGYGGIVKPPRVSKERGAGYPPPTGQCACDLSTRVWLWMLI